MSNDVTSPAVSERNIQVTFDIKPKPGCPLTNVQTEVNRVMVDREGDTCRCDLVLTVHVDDEVGTLVAQVSGDVDECAGTVFDRYGCVPEVTQVTDSHLTVRTFMCEDCDLDGLLSDLEAVCESVKLKRVTTNFDKSVGRMVKDVDLTDFTEKQRETIETAIRKGYYSRPRQVSLEELADQFGVSEQALAQRLSRAEQKVMEQLVSEGA